MCIRDRSKGYMYYGYDGKPAFKTQFTSAEIFDQNGLAVVSKKDDKYYLINQKGKKVSKTYSRISYIGEKYYAGFISDSKYEIIDTEGKKVIDDNFMDCLLYTSNPNSINQSIQEELIKIENYLQQVLFYARSENVEKDYLIKEVNLNDVVNTVIKQNKKDLISKRIKIELNNLNIQVYSDKKWLGFILNQIINNAIKYVNQDPVRCV